LSILVLVTCFSHNRSFNIVLATLRNSRLTLKELRRIEGEFSFCCDQISLKRGLGSLKQNTEAISRLETGHIFYWWSCALAGCNIDWVRLQIPNVTTLNWTGCTFCSNGSFQRLLLFFSAIIVVVVVPWKWLLWFAVAILVTRFYLT